VHAYRCSRWDASAAEDCLQETFVRALRTWPRWRPNDPAEAWLYRIAMKVAVPYRRRDRLHALGERVRRLGNFKGATPLDDGAWSPGLLAALRRLPPNDAAIIVLRYGHGYANGEIATAFGGGRNRGGVASRSRQGLAAHRAERKGTRPRLRALRGGYALRDGYGRLVGWCPAARLPRRSGIRSCRRPANAPARSASD
jgi:RNA polymerase sigma factor (sigma-70 family)